MEEIVIEGKKYHISPVDTEETIRNMIALEKKTFSAYIKFPVFDLEKGRIQVETLSSHLKDVPIGNLEKVLAELAPEWPWVDFKKNAPLEWLEINVKKDPETEKREGKLGPFDIPIIDTFKRINSVEFWDRDPINKLAKTYEKERQDYLKNLMIIVERESKFRQDYLKYHALSTTEFLQDSVIVEYDITIKLDPLEAFDNISLNNAVPFVSFNSANSQLFFKLHENFVPPKKLLEMNSTPNTFLFKIQKSESEDSESEEGTIVMKYLPDTIPYNAIVTLEIHIEVGGTTSEEDAKNTIFSLFTTEAGIEIKDRREKGLKGIFAVPGINISRDVFLNLITNEKMVSHFLYVDETRELSSVKNVLYLYYSTRITSGDTGDALTAFLSERTTSYSDPFYNAKQLALFTSYLNVRVSRATSIGQIERFKTAFATILDIYQKKFAEIVKEYTAVIPSFQSENKMGITATRQTQQKKLQALQILDSRLFVQGYPEKCEPKKQPIPIDKSKVSEKEAEGYEVLNYPEDSDNFFICEQTGIFKYPGLQKNNLSNKDTYPFFPCCYQKSQKEINERKLAGLKTVKKTKTGTVVLKKAIERNRLGFLPKNVYYVLNQGSKSEGYYRYGTEIGNSSFIEAVLLAFDPNFRKVPVDQRTMRVKDFRNNLAPIAFQNKGSFIQEVWDYDMKKVNADILDDTIPFDSEIFTGLLESYFSTKDRKVQIIVFYRNPDHPNGDIELARYTQGYLFERINPAFETALVYKHFGSRSDNLNTYHYELIIHKKPKETMFAFKGAVVEKLYTYFLQIYKLYEIGLSRYLPINSEFLESAATSQVVDNYGKMRGVFFDAIFMITSPLTPFQKLPIVETPQKEQLPTVDAVMSFIKKWELTVISQSINKSGQITGIRLAIPRVTYAYIPVQMDSAARLSNVSVMKNAAISDLFEKGNVLQETLHNKKIAGFLMQYILYSFSLWTENMGNTDIDTFLKERTMIVPDYPYDLKNFPRKMTTNNNFFQGTKLIVNSQKTLAGLSFYLRLAFQRDPNAVLGYFKKLYLDDYYLNASDFKEREGQMVFIGLFSISNWVDMQGKGVNNQIYTIPQPTFTEPYFFQHWSISSPIVIQNVKGGTLGRALAVSAGFYNKKVNLGFNVVPIKMIDHSTYSLQETLRKEGTSPVAVWKYAENLYAGIL